MANPLRAFTARGLGLICLGLALAIGGFAIGERDLVALGVLAFTLPLLSMLTVIGAPRRAVHSRALQPPRVTAGSEARVLIRVANSSAVLPIGGLLAADTLPFPLGQEPRFSIGYLRPRAARDITYRVRAHVRGLYPIGPLKLSCTDPLGCVRIRREVGTHMSLLVTPSVVPLPQAPLPGGSANGGDTPARSMSGGGEDDPVPRVYRGDDLRRVHWRSTARHGELMVRREEHQWSDRSAVLVDMRASAHAGVGPDSSLETAVGTAGSIALHLLGRGQDLRLLSGGREIAGSRAESVLDALAVLGPSATADLSGETGVLADASITGNGLLITVLGALGSADLGALVQARGAREHRCVAVLCQTAAWPSPDTARQAADALSQAGWLVLEIGSIRELAGVWHRLPAHSGARGGRR